MSYFGVAPIPSTLNATASPLAGGATYTGTWERAERTGVIVQTYSDVAGTLYLDFSVDGTNQDSTYPINGVATTASTPTVYPAAVGARYFRVRYINGSSAQSTFRLEAGFCDVNQFYAALNNPINLSSPAIITRSTFPWLDISRGLTTGMTSIEKFGYNESVGATFEPICYGGTYRTPTTAESIEFVSSSASDALNSTGMHEITLEGLDANWELQTVSTAAHPTDGTVAVSVSGTWTRVFRAYISSSGTYATSAAGSHVGTITIRVAGGGATYSTIPLINSFPIGQSLIGAYTVPLGYTGYVFLKDITSDTGKTINPAFFFRANANDVTSSYSPMRVQEIKTGLSGGAVYNGSTAKVPLGPFTGPCDIGYMAYSSGGGGNAVVTAEFEIFLVNE